MQNDIEKYSELKNVEEGEIEAIVKVLHSEIEGEGEKSFWKSVAVNFVFFILGALVTFIITLIVK